MRQPYPGIPRLTVFCISTHLGAWHMTSNTHQSYILWDAAFIGVITAYVLFGLWGVSLLSCDGLKISSDLCCYVQNIAGEMHRELFSQDPLLAAPTTANSIISLESTLARLLQPGGDIVQGLLRAGAAGVFFHYAACYYLGRRLWGSPLLAALFALLTGVTVWVSFGTYWGFGSGDITPRVFYAALFPLLLAATLSALDKPQLRPLILFASGCGMYLHSISSLVASCMLFTVFFFHRAKGDSLRRHAGWLLLSLAAWCIPTLLYLCSAIKSATVFSANDLAVFQQVFDRRFLEDEGSLCNRLVGHLYHRSDCFPLLVSGVVSFFIVRRCGSPIMKRLASIVPTLLLGVGIAVLFSVVETSIAERLHRLPMGAELPRGVRFIIFLCWLMLVGAFACLWQRAPRWAGLAAIAAVVCVLVFDQGRWATGVRFAFAHSLNLPQPKHALHVLSRGADYAEALQAVEKFVPQGAPLFAEPDAMAVRYRLYRPLSYAFKDGSSYLYSQDAQGAARWLDLVTIRDKQGLTATWLASGTEWILCGKKSERENIARQGTIVWSSNRWFIAKRGIAAEIATP